MVPFAVERDEVVGVGESYQGLLGRAEISVQPGGSVGLDDRVETTLGLIQGRNGDGPARAVSRLRSAPTGAQGGGNAECPKVGGGCYPSSHLRVAHRPAVYAACWA